MEADFFNGYCVGDRVFYISATNSKGNFQFVDDEVHASQANAVFESQLDTDLSLTAYKNKMFFIWDDNHKYFTWTNYIDRIYTEDFEHHVFVESIILAPEPDDILSLLTAMHDINKYVLPYYFLHSYFVYVLFSKLYDDESNQFNVFFQVNQKLSRIHKFGAYFISDPKYWHHAFDFLQKVFRAVRPKPQPAITRHQYFGASNFNALHFQILHSVAKGPSLLDAQPSRQLESPCRNIQSAGVN